jgi:hypothetical protein
MCQGHVEAQCLNRTSFILRRVLVSTVLHLALDLGAD